MINVVDISQGHSFSVDCLSVSVLSWNKSEIGSYKVGKGNNYKLLIGIWNKATS